MQRRLQTINMGVKVFTLIYDFMKLSYCCIAPKAHPLFEHTKPPLMRYNNDDGGSFAKLKVTYFDVPLAAPISTSFVDIITLQLVFL